MHTVETSVADPDPDPDPPDPHVLCLPDTTHCPDGDHQALLPTHRYNTGETIGNLEGIGCIVIYEKHYILLISH